MLIQCVTTCNCILHVYDTGGRVAGQSVVDVVRSPVGGIKLILPSHDLLEELRVVLMVERRVATQSEGRKRERRKEHKARVLTTARLSLIHNMMQSFA